MSLLRIVPVFLLMLWVAGCGQESPSTNSSAAMNQEPDPSVEAAAVSSLPDGELDGEALYLACIGCHSLADGAPHKVGPNLFGIGGQVAGTRAEFNYSAPLVEAGQSGLVWNQGTLIGWIMMTAGMLPGTWMLYHNVLKPDEVQRVVGYILDQSPADTP